MAAAAAVFGLLAGCGQAAPSSAPLGPAAQGRLTSAAPSATANRQAAHREADRLLSLVRVPPNAVTVASHPAALDGPALGMAAARSLVDRSRYWHVPAGVDATMAWIRAHRPRGLRLAGTTSGSGPSYFMLGVGYSEPDRPGMQDLELAIGVATLPGGGSAIRADGMAIWLDPRPLPDSRTGKRLRVTVRTGCPRSDADVVDVRQATGDNSPDLEARLLPAAEPTAALRCDYSGLNGRPAHHLLRSRLLGPAAAGKLARSVSAVSLAHPVGEIFHCPFGDGRATVEALSYPGRPDVDLWQDGSGCAFITNGRIMARV